VEEKDYETSENDDIVHEPQFEDNNNHFVPLSPPVLQQQSLSIAADSLRRNIAHRKRLIEEYSIIHSAMNSVEHVENDLSLLHIPKPLHVLTEKVDFCYVRGDQLLEKNGT
jgi:hypothetical protein